MDFLAQAALADDTDFRRRVKQAAIKAAINVRSEDPETAGHGPRIELARNILHSPDMYAVLFAQAVVTNGVISAASSDSDIEFTVNSLFGAFAAAN